MGQENGSGHNLLRFGSDNKICWTSHKKRFVDRTQGTKPVMVGAVVKIVMT